MHEDRCILVVDDFSTMRRIIKKILTKLNISNILEAENGMQAWEILCEHPVDLVICDWNMPGMTGMELLEKVREQSSLANLPFIMVTAESKTKVSLSEDQKKLTSYIAKPFKSEVLEEKLLFMLQGH